MIQDDVAIEEMIAGQRFHDDLNPALRKGLAAGPSGKKKAAGKADTRIDRVLHHTDFKFDIFDLLVFKAVIDLFQQFGFQKPKLMQPRGTGHMHQQ